MFNYLAQKITEDKDNSTQILTVIRRAGDEEVVKTMTKQLAKKKKKKKKKKKTKKKTKKKKTKTNRKKMEF